MVAKDEPNAGHQVGRAVHLLVKHLRVGKAMSEFHCGWRVARARLGEDFGQLLPNGSLFHAGTAAQDAQGLMYCYQHLSWLS